MHSQTFFRGKLVFEITFSDRRLQERWISSQMNFTKDYTIIDFFIEKKETM